MAYKLLAVDLDGTLLARDGTVHEADRLGIARLRAVGVPVTIVTGRLYSGSRAAAEAAGIRGPIACVDGSHILDAHDGTEHLHRSVAGAHAVAVREILSRYDFASFLFAHDSIAHDGAGAPFLPYIRTWSTKITVVDRLLGHHFWEHPRGVLAVLAIGATSQIERMVKALALELGDAVYAISFALQRVADTSAILVRAGGSTKGTAIEYLAKQHGCAPHEVVAVGDWLNDIPMFKAAGRSFAMAQAPDDVKDAATDRLTASALTGGGVAEAIDKAFGLR